MTTTAISMNAPMNRKQLKVYPLIQVENVQLVEKILIYVLDLRVNERC